MYCLLSNIVSCCLVLGSLFLFFGFFRCHWSFVLGSSLFGLGFELLVLGSWFLAIVLVSWLSDVRCVLCVACCLLFVGVFICYMLIVACRVLVVVSCLLFVLCCLLVVVCWLQFVGC